MHTTDQLLGDLEPPGAGRLEAVDYASGSPATGGLFRLRGEGWSWFCKVLQHVRHWPTLAVLPPPLAAHLADTFPWRSELQLWERPWVDTMPPGLRVPALHGVVDLGEDRLAVWMEDVTQAPPSCDLSLYPRAAHLLGRWNARCADPALLALSGYPAGYALRAYTEQAVRWRGLGPLEDDALWSHPWLAGHADLRAGLRALGPRIPEMLARLDGCVQAMPHGDASPQNLLVPADDPEGFVVIDVSFRSPHALGFDLGQLLVGLTHAGQVPAAMLPAIADLVVPAYLDGLAAEGLAVDGDEVRAAYATSVLVRSGFDGLPYDLLDAGTAEARHVVDERLALSGFLLDQYRSLAGAGR